MSPEPSSTISAMTPGNRRLCWRRPAERPPARAARATFLDDEALPMTPPRLSGGPAPARTQLLEELLVALGDRRRRGPALHEGPAGPAHGGGPVGVLQQGHDRVGERLGVLGGHGEPGAGLLDQPGDLGALVDAG